MLGLFFVLGTVMMIIMGSAVEHNLKKPVRVETICNAHYPSGLLKTMEDSHADKSGTTCYTIRRTTSGIN